MAKLFTSEFFYFIFYFFWCVRVCVGIEHPVLFVWSCHPVCATCQKATDAAVLLC